MLGKLRNFSKSKFAGVLITIIIIPFVFWGMGNVFSGGNKNSVVKINNQNNLLFSLTSIQKKCTVHKFV